MNEENDQGAREQFAMDLLDAYRRALSTGDQKATQQALIELGAKASAVASGELSLARGLLGAVLGSTIDEGAAVEDMLLIANGNLTVLHKLGLPDGRREQLERCLVFVKSEWDRLCEPGRSGAVLAAMVAMFSRTLVSIGQVDGRPD